MKKILRHIGASVLILAMVSAQTGVVFSFHFCKGELVESSVYLPVDECATESSEVSLACDGEAEDTGCSTSQMSDDCCSTKVISLHADQDVLQSKKIDVQNFHASTYYSTVTHSTPLGLPSFGISEVFLQKDRTVPLYIEFHQLIFYG